MKRVFVILLSLIIPILFAVNILLSFYIDSDDTFVGTQYMLQRFENCNFNTSQYIFEIANVGASWENVAKPDLNFWEGFASVFIALWDSIVLPFKIVFYACQDLLEVLTFIVDVLGYDPSRAVGG